MRCWVVVALCGVAAACSKSPGEQAEKAASQMRSWATASRMVLLSWADGKVPTAYATKSLEVAEQEASQTASKLEKGPQGGATRYVVASAAEFARHLALVRRAVEMGNRQAAAAAAAPLLEGDAGYFAALDTVLKTQAR